MDVARALRVRCDQGARDAESTLLGVADYARDLDSRALTLDVHARLSPADRAGSR
jgi:hypothetical protein